MADEAGTDNLNFLRSEFFFIEPASFDFAIIFVFVYFSCQSTWKTSSESIFETGS